MVTIFTHSYSDLGGYEPYMPKQYEAIRDKEMAKGASKKEAQATAAKIYNSKGKGHVGRGSR